MDEIRKIFGKVPSGADRAGREYFRAIVRQSAPAEFPEAPWNSLEGRPTDRVIVFGVDGRPKTALIRVSEHWFLVGNEIDSLQDLRVLGGRFGPRGNLPVGGRQYESHLRAAIDPDGSLGIRVGGTQAGPPESLPPAGALVQWIRKGPPNDADNQAAQRRIAEQRLPPNLEPSRMHLEGLAGQLVTAIARARRYRTLYEPAFERAALRMLVVCLHLINARLPQGAPLQDQSPAARAHGLGLASATQLIEIVEGARPGVPDKAYDDHELVRAVRELLGRVGPGAPAPEIGDFAKLRESRAGQPHPVRDQELLVVDPSERASVAIDALLVGNAVYHFPDGTRQRLVNALLDYWIEPWWPDLRADDRVPLRDKARRLLFRVVTRAAGVPAEVTEGYRAALLEQVGPAGARDASTRRYTRDAAVQVLNASGWGPPPAIAALSDSIFGKMDHLAWLIVRGSRETGAGDPAKAEANRRRRSVFEAELAHLMESYRSITLLAASGDAGEAEAGERAIERFRKLADAERKQSSEKGALLLGAWQKALAAQGG